jgi:mono/diheme cytochrome c family protein
MRSIPTLLEHSMRIPLMILALIAAPALAETPNDFLNRFQKEASVTGNPTRGAELFNKRHGGEWSCASCHTDNTKVAGRHAKTDKPIKPLAPSANAERFTDPTKVDKWFRRNCNDVLSRECSAGEKADVLAFLIAQK